MPKGQNKTSKPTTAASNTLPAPSNGLSSKDSSKRTPDMTSPFKSPRMQDFDPDNPDYIKELQRPAVIKEDLCQMERSKRVKQILDSKAFREELEKLIKSDQRGGETGDLTNLKSLEQLSDLILSSGGQKSACLSYPSSNAVIPIADLRGVAGSNYSKEEKIARNKFASLFRLMDLCRWTQGISNHHCSYRISDKHALTNSFCLMYHEITAGQLLKVNLNDLSLVNLNNEELTTTIGGESSLSASSSSCSSIFNRDHFTIHAAIYKARPDVHCIIPLTTPVTGAVTAMKCGLLPLSQEAMVVGEISCHEFQGYSISDPQEAQSIANDLGPKSQVLLLRNNGFLICTSSVEKAYTIAYHLFLACETQIRAVRAGVDNLVIPSQEAQQKVIDLVHNVGGGGVNKVADPEGTPKWKVGELEWEAWMRVLDNAGYRTGHVYRQNLSNVVKSPPFQSDVATPPCASSFVGGFDAVDASGAYSREHARRDAERARFLQHSPNYYQKDGRSSADSKKGTYSRWVTTSVSPSLGLQGPQPIRVTTTPHQFLPSQISPSISPNPKELKEKQKKIREQGRIDNISAGPQSKILEGVSYQEAAALKHLQETMVDGVECEKILIGAASKGIVDRDHRHNAQIFSQLYQSNPFASETDQEIQKYVHEVEQKTTPRTLHCESYNSGTLDRFGEIASAGSESPESVSLMQAARDLNLSRSTATPPPARMGTAARETTFEVNNKLNVVIGSKEQRPQLSPNIPEEKAVSEEESRAQNDASPRQKEKKKKFHRLSFLRKKKDKEQEKNGK